MRAFLLVYPLLVSLLLAGGASAQDSQPTRSPGVAVVTGGASDHGASLRIVRGGSRVVGSALNVGIVSRSAVSFSPGTAPDDDVWFSGAPSAYLESGASVRVGVPVSTRGEVALSAGMAIASQTLSWVPFDAGLTAPVEAEVSARVWRNVGLAASASVSLPIVSVWSQYEGAEGYSLRNRAVTLGLRFGM